MCFCPKLAIWRSSAWWHLFLWWCSQAEWQCWGRDEHNAAGGQERGRAAQVRCQSKGTLQESEEDRGASCGAVCVLCGPSRSGNRVGALGPAALVVQGQARGTLPSVGILQWNGPNLALWSRSEGVAEPQGSKRVRASRGGKGPVATDREEQDGDRRMRRGRCARLPREVVRVIFNKPTTYKGGIGQAG